MVDHIRSYERMLTPERKPLTDAEISQRRGLEGLARRDAAFLLPDCVDVLLPSDDEKQLIVTHSKESHLNE